MRQVVLDKDSPMKKMKNENILNFKLNINKINDGLGSYIFYSDVVNTPTGQWVYMELPMLIA